MSFTSLEYLLFLPIVFGLYWLIGACCKNLRWQNVFILVANYVFYGWWNWRLLGLILLISLCSWLSGRMIFSAQSSADMHRSRLYFALNIIVCLGTLCVFKYYDFFVQSFCSVFSLSADGILLNMILPIGISFYTFQALSYTIDVYRKTIVPTKDIIAYCAYISFFPQLVAGPIERAANLLPQFENKRTFDYQKAVDGLLQMAWGFFKKIVIADSCAYYVNQVWSSVETQNSSTLFIAAVIFSLQIYGDFSGYSDIAIGTGKLFGISLQRNFNNPYFSLNIADFWRRWHISLTSWFRDYVYIPLGGRRGSRLSIVRNIIIVFALSGLWHGANWTFVLWGIYNALLIMPYILTGNKSRIADNGMPSFKQCAQLLVTFMLVTIGWIIFRADSISQAWLFFSHVFTSTIIAMPYVPSAEYMIAMALTIILMMLVEWKSSTKQHALYMDAHHPILSAIILICLAVLTILFLGEQQEFIYFQF